MTYTFDEAFEKTIEIANEFEGVVPHEDIYVIIEQLREEYAPTIEMTKEQHDYIFPLIKEGKELGATFTEFWEVYEFTEPLKTFDMKFNNQEQAMQVWLHPETSKVVD